MAVGAFAAGYIVDLARAERHVAGLRHRSASGFVLSGLLLLLAGSRRRILRRAAGRGGGRAHRQRRRDPR